MGCGFVVVVRPDEAATAAEMLAAHHPGTRRIGTITSEAGRVTVPGLGLTFA
jgi:phosphoribosylformylglycinamidine cyclo-ligase